MSLHLNREAFTAEAPSPVEPAATLVLLRDAAAGMEVLLLRRGRQLSAFAGVWVFPGGAAEDTDGPSGARRSPQTAARFTAARELAEEAGLTVATDALVPLSRWTAPEVMRRRYDTWFFLAAAPDAPVRIDRSEIHDHRWIAPQAALAMHRDGHLPLYPPTWVTLHHLTAFHRCAAVLADARKGPVYHFAPRVVPRGADTCFLYGGDQAYDHLAIDQPGPRHRLWACREGWRYECTPDSGGPYAPSPA
jgi:8-oxo-dGTP pyrophosphatase MutT (NUDIX family)